MQTITVTNAANNAQATIFVSHVFGVQDGIEGVGAYLIGSGNTMFPTIETKEELLEKINPKPKQKPDYLRPSNWEYGPLSEL